MSKRHRDSEEKPLGLRGMLGVGVDNRDGHKRVTKGPRYYLVGGSKDTHERMQEFAMKFDEKVKERDKCWEEINGKEFKEIVDDLES